MTLPFAALALLVFPPEAQETEEAQEVRRLVEILGSDEPAQRDEAHAALSRKGCAIAPHLRRFLGSPSAEVASRVKSILDRFEWEEHLERSLPPVRRVTLPQGAYTVEEIFRHVRRQTGHRVVPYTMNLKTRVEVGWDGAPVLQVLDDLCRALGRGRPEPAALQENPWSRHGDNERAAGSSDELAIDGEKEPLRAVAHRDQFRSAITDVVVTEKRSLKTASTKVMIQLNLAAQPGTRPVHVGDWEVDEIVDDQGNSLAFEDPGAGSFREPAPPGGEVRDSVWFAQGRWENYDCAAGKLRIRPPAPGARTLARVRLRVKADFPGKEETATLAIKDAKERGTIRLAGATISVTRAEMEDGAFHLHYTLGGSYHGSPEFDLLDGEGRVLGTGGSGSNSSGNLVERYWHILGGAEVSSVRTSASIGHKSLEVAFEFRDVPLPGDR